MGCAAIWKTRFLIDDFRNISGDTNNVELTQYIYTICSKYNVSSDYISIFQSYSGSFGLHVSD
jgi:hypothetical protein